MLINRYFLILLLIVFSVISVSIGAFPLSLQALWDGDEVQRQILLSVRMPRLISLLIAGAALGVAGMIMQRLSRNRFVSPTTAGLTDSARFGILIALWFFPGTSMWAQAGVATLFTFGGALLFMFILSKLKHRNIVFVPLIGIMFGNIVSSITIFMALELDLMQSIAAWLHGDFSTVSEGRYELLYLTLPALILMYFYAERFMVVGLGESFAKNLGLSYQQVLTIGLLLVSLVTALVVITVGVIPFIGLVVPNIISMVYGDHLKRTLMPVALGGALLVLICDILARVVIYPFELSVSLIMGILGSAIFLALLMRNYRHGQ